MNYSGKSKQHKHKLFGPKVPGVENYLPIARSAGKSTSWCGRPLSLARTSMTHRVLKNLCPEKFALIFWSPKIQFAPPLWAPEQSSCASFAGKESKVPHGPFCATKFLLFFPAPSHKKGEALKHFDSHLHTPHYPSSLNRSACPLNCAE